MLLIDKYRYNNLLILSNNKKITLYDENKKKNYKLFLNYFYNFKQSYLRDFLFISTFFIFYFPFSPFLKKSKNIYNLKIKSMSLLIYNLSNSYLNII